VNKATKDLDLFMRKDPPVLTMDEMRGSSSLIDKYGLHLKRERKVGITIQLIFWSCGGIGLRY
jgi:hypothetical protein